MDSLIRLSKAMIHLDVTGSGVSVEELEAMGRHLPFSFVHAPDDGDDGDDGAGGAKGACRDGGGGGGGEGGMAEGSPNTRRHTRQGRHGGHGGGGGQGVDKAAPIRQLLPVQHARRLRVVRAQRARCLLERHHVHVLQRWWRLRKV